MDRIPDRIAGKSVGEIVTADYRTASVFTRYGIDFCCGGQKPIEQATEEAGVSLETLLRDLDDVEKEPGVAERYDQWAADFLADYVVNQFHTYTRNVMPEILEFAATVANVHGDTHPETRVIAALWPKVQGELVMHMQKEELLLFPYIKRLVRSEAEGDTPAPPPFGSAEDLIQQMEAEHDDTGDALAEIEQRSGGYAIPDDACATYKALYSLLREFDEATKKHVHLENNILFPKTIRLERSLRAV